jgi:hypothetical protein
MLSKGSGEHGKVSGEHGKVFGRVSGSIRKPRRGCGCVPDTSSALSKPAHRLSKLDGEQSLLDGDLCKADDLLHKQVIRLGKVNHLLHKEVIELNEVDDLLQKEVIELKEIDDLLQKEVIELNEVDDLL